MAMTDHAEATNDMSIKDRISKGVLSLLQFFRSIPSAFIASFRAIPADLAVLSLHQRIFVTIFGIVMVVFSIVDFSYFLNDSLPSPIKWINDRDVWEMETWRLVLMTFSGISSFSGAVCVFLAALGRHSAWSWGFINTVFYGMFAFAYGYAGDAQLYYFYFLPLQFVGMVAWEKRLDEEGTAFRSPSMSFKSWLFALVVSGIVFVIFFYEIPAFSKAFVGYYIFEGIDGKVTVPWVLDALSNAFNAGGQILMIQRQWEQWLFWIAVNVIQLAMFSGVAGFGVDFNILCMFSFFLVNSLYGLWSWYRRPVKNGIYDLGVVVGKFYPPHKGHEYLVNEGIRQCKRFVAIVCVRPEEKPNKERVEWLQQNCPGAEVVVFDQPDGMDPDDSVLWANTTLKILGQKPDASFSSESYGEPFSKALGSIDVRVDQARAKVSISGTAVRNNPFENWDYLSPNVRQYYSNLIVLVGAESTGKTTLSNSLVKHFEKYSPQLVEEHGRVVSERKKDPYQDWSNDDFMEIAKVQTANEMEAMKQSYLVISDTDTRATAEWQEYLMGETSADIEELASKSPVPDLFLFCPIEGVPFIQDGTRKDGEHRSRMEQQLKERCIKTGAKIIYLSGNWDERKEVAIEAVTGILSDSNNPNSPLGNSYNV